MSIPHGASGHKAKASRNGADQGQRCPVVTVGSLAAAKGLPADWLRQNAGLRDLAGGGVGVPYYDFEGAELFVRERDRPGGPRFKQPDGVQLAPYGRNRLDEAARAGRLFVTEGESDAWTLWHVGRPALGLPGAHAAKALAAEDVAAVERVVLVPDNDNAGRQFAEGIVRRLAALGFKGRVGVLRLPEGVKDVSELWLRQPTVEAFRSAWDGLAVEEVVAPDQATEGRRPRRTTDRRSSSITRRPRSTKRPPRRWAATATSTSMGAAWCACCRPRPGAGAGGPIR
jgi:hypothetical protein